MKLRGATGWNDAGKIGIAGFVAGRDGLCQ